MTMNLEIRYSNVLSVREDNGQTIISGLAVPYYNGLPGTEYELAKGYYERFQRGSFPSLADVSANLQHNTEKILGVTPDTLKIRETDRGLEYDIVLDDSSYSRDAKQLVASGKLRGSSIGFMPEKTEQKRDGDKTAVLVTRAKLDHIALVTRPAYKATDTYLRSIQEENDRMLTEIYKQRLYTLLGNKPQAAKI